MKQAKITRFRYTFKHTLCINNFKNSSGWPIKVGSEDCFDNCPNKIALEEVKIKKQLKTYSDFVVVCYIEGK